METRSDRLVLVPARQLDDLAELARLASNRLDDPVLADALRGAVVVYHVDYASKLEAPFASTAAAEADSFPFADPDNPAVTFYADLDYVTPASDKLTLGSGTYLISVHIQANGGNDAQFGYYCLEVSDADEPLMATTPVGVYDFSTTLHLSGAHEFQLWAEDIGSLFMYYPVVTVVRLAG